MPIETGRHLVKHLLRHGRRMRQRESQLLKVKAWKDELAVRSADVAASMAAHQQKVPIANSSQSRCRAVGKGTRRKVSFRFSTSTYAVVTSTY
jgi:hypothetical protein